MTEVVWVALISAGTALVTALLTQLLATRAAHKQADRADKREALQWQRSEALRREELQRKDAQDTLTWERADELRKQALHDARLRELWGHVLTARWQVMDSLERVSVKGKALPKSADVSAAASSTSAAAQAYAAALLGLAAVRPSAKEFYAATVTLDFALRAVRENPGNADQLSAQVTEAGTAWNASYKVLENAVAQMADGLVEPNTVGEVEQA